MMTGAQREAVIERMALDIWASDGLGRAEGWDRTPNQDVYRRRASAAFDALLEDHVVLPRDDATTIGWALREVATRPTTELNPDGVDQAAWSMQLIAQEALTRWEQITSEDENT